MKYIELMLIIGLISNNAIFAMNRRPDALELTGWKVLPVRKWLGTQFNITDGCPFRECTYLRAYKTIKGMAYSLLVCKPDDISQENYTEVVFSNNSDVREKMDSTHIELLFNKEILMALKKIG